MQYQLTINGQKKAVEAAAEMPLLWVLRNELGLVGSKFGCGVGICGACTVHVNGDPLRSCQLPVGQIAASAKIVTIEGIGETAIGRKLQEAWIDLDVPQCGYCQAGQIMSAAALLRRTPRPTAKDVVDTMSDNICRCLTYQRIQKAILQVAGVKGSTDAA